MSDLGNEIFAEARRDYRRALKWQGIALLGFAFLHLAVIAPMVDVSARHAVAEANLGGAESRKAAVDEIVSAARAFDTAAQGEINTLIDDALQSKIEAFRRLDEPIAGLREIGPERAGGPEGEVLIGQIWSGSGQLLFQQQPVDANPLFKAEVPSMPANMRRAAADRVVGITDLRVRLNPWVTKAIIDPTFERINRDLLAAMTAGVVGRSEPIKAKIEAAVAVGVARDEPALVEVGALLTETVAAARALHYQPPDDPLWWTTVTGKIDALTPRDLRFAIGEIEALGTLSRNSTRLVTAISSQSENLESEIARLEAVFDEARQDIASAFGLSAGLPLSLDAVARWFPALLAAVFAGFIAWQVSTSEQN